MKNRDKKNQHNTTLSGSREFTVSSARNFGARDSTKDDDDAKEESRARELDRAKEIYDCVCTRSV